MHLSDPYLTAHDLDRDNYRSHDRIFPFLVFPAYILQMILLINAIRLLLIQCEFRILWRIKKFCSKNILDMFASS